MSDSESQPNRQSKIAYLTELLQIGEESGAMILAKRNHFLGLERQANLSRSEDVAEGAALDLPAISAQLERLRESFWAHSSSELQLQLEQIDVTVHCRYESLVNRLSIVALEADAFNQLCCDPKCDLGFLSMFKEILIQSGRETISFRQQMLEMVSKLFRIKRIKRTISLIKRETPLIYQLESDWFFFLLRNRKRIFQWTLRRRAFAVFIVALLVFAIALIINGA